MSEEAKRIIDILNDMIDYGWGFSDNEVSPSISACEYSIRAIEKLEEIKQVVMISPDEFKQCGLRELKEILEILSEG